MTSPRGRSVAVAALLGPVVLAHAGCAPDVITPGYYAGPDDPDGGAQPPGQSPAAAEEPLDASSSQAANGGDGGPATVGDAEVASARGPCDLTGRWLVTSREVETALGAVEAAHFWRYYELTQTGSAITVSKGLVCGANVRGLSAVAATVDYPKTWPAMLANDVETGRKGTSTPTSSGCQVTFEKQYMVLGATASFYKDPSTALPTASQQAASGSPGWEDWDQDGNPGYTLNMTGLVTGQLYLASREWATWSGTVATGASSFTLSDDWNSDLSVLGINGPSLLTEATSGVRDSDATLRFAGFARLGATQATGDDAAICAAVRSLAPTLTPTASN
jgi:hypothetical protein